MMHSVVDFEGESGLLDSPTGSLLGLAADRARPVRFHADLIAHTMPVRLALQSLGELIWHSDEWVEDYETLLDPIVTVHPDRVLFEAFSSDQSSFGLVAIDRAAFASDGVVQHGTTNIDFTRGLWRALGRLRSSRRTSLQIGAAGVAVRTDAAAAHVERKVDVPDAWVRGFLQLQAAMALPGTRLDVRPVDLLSALRFMRSNKAKIAPRALRYELTPGRDAELVLEPWEQRVALRGAGHAVGRARSVRTWGRRRLRLLEPLLPYAESMQVHLRGRAMPSFYALRLPGVSFVLGLSGWTGQKWTDSASFDLLAAPGDPQREARVHEALARRTLASARELAEELGQPLPQVSEALAGLCAAGRCTYDLEKSAYRHRELFAAPPDLSRLYPPDPRRAQAEALRASGAIEGLQLEVRETRQSRTLRIEGERVQREVLLRDLVGRARVGEQPEVEIVLNDEQRMIFGRCGCPFFTTHLLSRGPCAHQLALLWTVRERQAAQGEVES